MDRLGIEFISAMGMPPLDFVRMAAALGVSRIGLSPTPITDNVHGYPAWDLRTDLALHRDTKAALADSGVSVSIGEGFLIMPGLEIADSAALMDIMADLGAPVVNCVLVEQDRARGQDEFDRFVAMAGERGMTATLEFMPLFWPANLAEAGAVVDASGAGNAALLIDAMHLYRSGATETDIAGLPQRIGYVQICDVPMPATNPDYGDEARLDRLPPGDGDLPLGRLIQALPRDVTIGLELPMIGKARAGIMPEEALKPAVAAARALLAAL